MVALDGAPVFSLAVEGLAVRSPALERRAVASSNTVLLYCGEELPEAELFVRWVQQGVLQPRFVIHSGISTDGENNFTACVPCNDQQCKSFPCAGLRAQHPRAIEMAQVAATLF